MNERLGAYEIRGLIGVGGMGEVYRAHDTKLGRDVALKILPSAFTADSDRLARFEREARVLASLTHPNIGAIYGVEESSGVRALVLELVEGPTLADRLATGPLPVTDAIAVAAQIAHALEAAHEKGIIHRDLKPANIKITPSGLVKVLDFGIAKITTADPESRTAFATEAGMIVGTAAYMSPEQAAGLDVDKRTDVWAFGCVLYEMLTGAPAATRDTDMSRLPAATPQEVRRLVARCLQPDRRQRLRDIGDAWLELNAVMRGDSDRERPAAPAGHKSRSLAIAVVLVVVAATAAWFVLRTSRSAERGPRVEFTVAPPEGVTWGELPPDPGPKISPNGQMVVFEGHSAAGSTGLWMRNLTTVDARLLPGTQDYVQASQAFWSPDSTAVAYCLGDRLKKIDLGGRPPEEIPANCSWDGSWSSRGELLITGDGGGLFRLSDKGGPATRVTTPVPGSGHRYPRWTPDNQHFFFTVLGPSPDVRGIFVGSIDGTPPRRVLADYSKADYVEPGDGRGYLFFVRASTLMIQAMTTDSFMAIGEPATIAGKIGMGLGRMPPASAASTALVYRSGAAFGDASIAWMDREGHRVGMQYAAGTPVIGLALSHDEKTIAFERFNRDSNNIEVWTADVARGTEALVQAAPVFVNAPVFSPDDRQLLFATAFRPRVLTRATGAIADLNPKAILEPWDWGTDGTILGGSQFGIFITKVGSTVPATVLLKGGFHSKLSPDGHWLAYTSFESGAPQVVVQHFPDGGFKTQVSTMGGFQPRWRPDGKELFYLTSDGDLMAARIQLGARVDAGAPVRLFRERFKPDGANFAGRAYAVSKDGQRFLVLLASSEPKPLTVVRNWLSGLPK